MYLRTMNCFQFGMEDFSSNEDKDLKYLQGALTSLYGEAAALPPENVVKFIADVTDSDLV